MANSPTKIQSQKTKRPGKPENLTNAGKGRPKGAQNKTTALLKDAILKAAEKAGGKGGTIGYLTKQAQENPGPFMALLGKVLPMEIKGPGANGEHVVVVRVEYVD
jgi:hypothetical protein